MASSSEKQEPSTPERHSVAGEDVESHNSAAEAEKSGMAPLERVETEYPSTKALCLIMGCLYVATFLFALDRTIIGTAIPQITDEFDSFGDVGWYGSAYLLTFCAFQLIFGRIVSLGYIPGYATRGFRSANSFGKYTFYSAKWVYIIVIGIFEVGSIVCAAAPNSNAFIVGRAVAGLGSSGMISGAVIILINSVPLARRPVLMGIFGAVFGAASVAGPLLGGVFTTDVTWRWCFWINVPLGGVVVFALGIILKSPPAVKRGTPWKEQLNQLDPFGTLVFLPGIVCILLALQWGGTVYPWNSGRVIALLVVGIVLLIVFVCIQFWRGEYATVPPRIMKQRSIAAGFEYIFFGASTMMVAVYYIPIYFQAIQGTSAVESGIRNLPLLLALVVASILAGIFTQKVGYYTPLMILGGIIMPIGAGLITTWNRTTGHSEWIGYQVILGFGTGVGMQQASVAAQTVLDKKDVPTGASLMFFGQSLGGTIFISVAQNVLSNRLVAELSDVPGFNTSVISSTGATDLRRVVQAKYLNTVLNAYSDALTDCFYVGTAVAAMAIFGAVAMEWKSVKAKKTA